jgi:hypothetical protein
MEKAGELLQDCFHTSDQLACGNVPGSGLVVDTVTNTQGFQAGCAGVAVSSIVLRYSAVREVGLGRWFIAVVFLVGDVYVMAEHCGHSKSPADGAKVSQEKKGLKKRSLSDLIETDQG